MQHFNLPLMQNLHSNKSVIKCRGAIFIISALLTCLYFLFEIHQRRNKLKKESISASESYLSNSSIGLLVHNTRKLN